MATSVAVLVIAASFTGLFSMQADYFRTLELEDLLQKIKIKLEINRFWNMVRFNLFVVVHCS